MADWSQFNLDNSYPYDEESLEHLRPHCTRVPAEEPFPSSSSLTLLAPPIFEPPHEFLVPEVPPMRESPHELHNMAEKQRKRKMNESNSHLKKTMPSMAAKARRLDRLGVLRLTAHYLRSHQQEFGDSVTSGNREFNFEFTTSLLNTLRGFLITITYKGTVVVASPNVEDYLGFNFIDMHGKNICSYVHEADEDLLKEQLSPPTFMFGPDGELLLFDDPEGKKKITEALSEQKRNFIIRFKKVNEQSSGPPDFLTCHIQGIFRKADKVAPWNVQPHRCRSRNDAVFIGLVRPLAEAYISSALLKSMTELQTRHAIDGQVIPCDQRIALVTAYMTNEINGLNALNFMHRDDVRLVMLALRESEL